MIKAYFKANALPFIMTFISDTVVKSKNNGANTWKVAQNKV